MSRTDEVQKKKKKASPIARRDARSETGCRGGRLRLHRRHLRRELRESRAGLECAAGGRCRARMAPAEPGAAAAGDIDRDQRPRTDLNFLSPGSSLVKRGNSSPTSAHVRMLVEEHMALRLAVDRSLDRRARDVDFARTQGGSEEERRAADIAESPAALLRGLVPARLARARQIPEAFFRRPDPADEGRAVRLAGSNGNGNARRRSSAA